MAVIIREERIIGGKKEKNIKVFKSDRLLTTEARKQAEELDDFLSQKMDDIAGELKGLDLVKLKGKRRGVLKLWYELGMRLSFVMDTAIVMPEDRRHVWRALYDHAGDLSPGTPKTRASKGYRNHFSYCYKIGQLDWDFVNGAGDWSAWVEFHDSQVIRDDGRIIKWLGLKSKDSSITGRGWLRPLAKSIRNSFKGMDTSIFSEKELFEKLEKIYANNKI
jgi:hypothetical protein